MTMMQKSIMGCMASCDVCKTRVEVPEGKKTQRWQCCEVTRLPC